MVTGLNRSESFTQNVWKVLVCYFFHLNLWKCSFLPCKRKQSWLNGFMKWYCIKNTQWTAWNILCNRHVSSVLWQNTVDKLIKKTNLALLVGTNSWRDQFIEAITVSAGKAMCVCVVYVCACMCVCVNLIVHLFTEFYWKPSAVGLKKQMCLILCGI